LELDSLKLVPLTSERVFHGGPVFSPDGKTLAFTKRSIDGNSFNLYVSDSFAKHQRRVTEGDFFDLGPSFSVDGARLIFFRAHRKRAYSLGGESWNDWDLYTVDADGSHLRRLTTEHYYMVDAPHFLAGGEIVFSAQTHSGGMKLYVFDQSAVPPVHVLEGDAVDRYGSFSSGEPDVCPEKNEIVFVSNRASRQAPYDYELWALYAGSTRAVQLTHARSLIEYPIFDRSCGRIFFMSDVDRKGASDLCVCQADGSDTRKLYPALFKE
jgi:Tol biopolymer transport system component